MRVQHEESEAEGLFYIEIEGIKQGEMFYSKTADKQISINSTIVGDKLRGKGAGIKLIKAAVQYARENEITIIPLCTYASSVFAKTEEYKDVLVID